MVPATAKLLETAAFCCLTTVMYQVPVSTPGKLYVMPHPEPDRLDQALGAIRGDGVEMLVSLLDDHDIAAIGLEREAELCAASGLTFIRFPIADYGLPQPGPFAELVDNLAGELSAGRSIAIHCRAGIGRTGMLACCILKQLGASADDAIQSVSWARQSRVPDTVEQRRFIVAFGRRVAR